MRVALYLGAAVFAALLLSCALCSSNVSRLRYGYGTIDACHLKTLGELKYFLKNGSDINEPFYNPDGKVGFHVLSGLLDEPCGLIYSDEFEEYMIFYLQNGGVISLNSLREMREISLQNRYNKLLGILD